MATQRLTVRVAEAWEGRRLDRVLGDWLPGALQVPLSKSAVRRLVMAGAVSVDGRPTRSPAQLVGAGQRLEARVDRDRLTPAADSAASFPAGDRVQVLFEDRWLLAVAKPAGLQMHASADRSRADLFSLVLDLLRHRAGVSDGSPYLGLHHRLDIDTSGVTLFAIDRDANAGLARAFASRQVSKVYEAITVRPAVLPPDRWTARGALALTGSGRRARVSVVRDGAAASTACAVVRRFRLALLVEARPETGRKHQIRAHLADAGLPILGDPRYGGPSLLAGVPVPRVMLHAASIELNHPITGRPLEIRCPRPIDFQRVLDRLERPGGSLDTPRASRYPSTRLR